MLSCTTIEIAPVGGVVFVRSDRARRLRQDKLVGNAKKLKKQLRNYAPTGATNMAE